MYRDGVRSFLKSDKNTAWNLCERLIGSPDIYKIGHRPAGQSVNYVTCHDGFTLNDLVSFHAKHNDANRSQNCDGTNANLSWNCGAEGPSNDPEVESLRVRQIKNFFALTLLSVGTPMLLMGDEVRRTQQGNNNAYCLDNEVSWFNWDLCKSNAEIFRFVQKMIRLRLDFNLGTGDAIALEDYLRNAQITWHGTSLDKPDWSCDSHSIALAIHNHALNEVRYLAINAYWKTLEFELPPIPDSKARWTRMIDTSLPSPQDIAEAAEGSEVLGATYEVNPHSLVMLHFASPGSGAPGSPS
jgi:glycogen operon protein